MPEDAPVLTPDGVTPDLLLKVYAEQVPRRVPVPSDREREVGADGHYEFRPAPPPPEFGKIRPLSLIWQSFKALNPRGIAGPDAPAKPLVIFGLLTLLFTLNMAGFSFLLIFIKADMHFNFAVLTTIMAAGSIVALATGPFTGWLADRWKRVWMVRIGNLITHGAVLMASFAPGPGLLLASRMLTGLGPGISQPAQLPLLADYYPLEKRTRVFAFLGVFGAFGGGMVVTAVVFSYIALGLTWREILFATGLLGTGLSFLLFMLREPVRGAVDRKTIGAAPAPPPPPVPFAEGWRVASNIKTLRRLWYAQPFLTIGYGIASFLFFVIYAKLQSNQIGGPGVGLLTNPSLQRYTIIFFAAIPNMLTVVGLSLSGVIGDRLMRVRPGRIMLLLGMVSMLQAVGFLAFIFCPWFIVDMGLSWIVGAAAGMILPIQFTLLSSIIPARIRGLGFQTTAPFALLGYCLQPIFGVIADQAGIDTAVLIEAVFLLAGALIVASGTATVAGDIRSALAASLADEEVQAARKRGVNKLLVCRDVDVSYDGSTVLFHVNLDVEEGELVALLGTNGAGKSTLLRAIAGVQAASSGAVFLNGEDVTHKAVHDNARDGVVFLPGGQSVFPTLTVAENLRTAAWLYREDTEYVRGAIEKVLDFFPVLRERIAQQAGNLSGGEQRMLGLGQAMCMRPRLLMIDELSLGLAPAIVDKLLDMVQAINRQGTTVILVEQSVNVAVTIARRAVFMDKGVVHFDGPIHELLNRRDLVRSVFLGGASGPMIGIGTARRRGYADERERVLAADGIELSYGGVHALSGVGVDVFFGEVVGVIGPNGAGKTSFLDVLSGVTRPDAGRVILQATEVTRMPPDGRARLGLVRSFQSTRLFPSLTVRENIAVALERKLKVRSAMLSAAWLPRARASERRAFRRVEYLIDLLRLGAYADKFVNEVSTGTRRMVDLACVLAAEPKVLLLDEPSSGLAQPEIETLGPAVRRLALESGCGILCIEHDIPLITQMSDRLVALERGRVIASGKPEDVMNDERVVSAYLNASTTVIQRSGELTQALAAMVGEPSS